MFDAHKLSRLVAPRRRFAAALQSALVLAVTATAGSAHAHYILLKPEAAFEQDMSAFGGGAPQKGGPCGPGGFDDDGSGGKPTGMVAEAKPGDMLHVEWMITVDHAGYFRIALAKDPSEFKDPTFTDPVACTYDEASVKKGAHDNVLMDGISATATMQDVKIPDAPGCTDCTLQVIQVMKMHGPPNCIYYHCAKVHVTGGGGDTTTAGAGGSAGSAGSAGTAAGMGGMGGMAGSAEAGMSAAGSAAAGMTGAAGTTMSAAGTTAPPPTTPPATNPPMTITQPVSGGPAAGAGGSAAPAMSPSSSKDSGGCAVSATGGASTHTPWLLLGLAAGALVRRRRYLRGALR